MSNNYGLFLCQTGREAQSLAYFDAALQDAAYGTPELALHNAAACSLVMKDYPRAASYWLKAERIAPGAAITYAGLVRVYYQQQDYRQAAHYLERLGKVATMESQTADVLWLGIKVQHKLGDAGAEAGLGAHLRNHHSGSPNMLLIKMGRLMSETGIPMNSEWAETPQQQPQGNLALAGAQLKAQREALGWPVEQVADQLKLAPRQVIALEEGDMAALPNLAVVRGFVRAYAKVVRLDAAPLVAMIEVHPAPAQDPAAPVRREISATFSESRFPR